MQVPRQGATAETGRIDQKRRTRAAIVTAARQLLQEGITPTVAQAAEAAQVSRTTAYRYFPTQDALLLEIAVTVDVDEIEALVARPLDGESPRDRVLEILARLNRHVVADETSYRAVMRLYLDLWLAAVAAGDTSPVVREGRRQRWIAQSLAPVRGFTPDADVDRLVAALSVVTGPEAISVLRDIARLDTDEALEVAGWAARTLIDAVLPSEPGPPHG